MQTTIQTLIGNICSLVASYTDIIVDSVFFKNYGLVFMFFYAISPSIFFIPNEFFITPLVLGGTNLYLLAIVVGIGSFIGDIPLYYLGKFGYTLFSGKKKTVADSKHMMHKYRYLVFLAPVVPFVPSVIIEILMVIAGHQHLDVKKILPVVFVAELIKAGLVVATVAGIVTLSASAC